MRVPAALCGTLPLWTVCSQTSAASTVACQPRPVSTAVSNRLFLRSSCEVGSAVLWTTLRAVPLFVGQRRPGGGRTAPDSSSSGRRCAGTARSALPAPKTCQRCSETSGSNFLAVLVRPRRNRVLQPKYLLVGLRSS